MEIGIGGWLATPHNSTTAFPRQRKGESLKASKHHAPKQPKPLSQPSSLPFHQHFHYFFPLFPSFLHSSIPSLPRMPAHLHWSAD
jgi:hypothetical protein